MRKLIFLSICILLISLFLGCQGSNNAAQIAATTLPVYEFTDMLCEGTGLSVARVITEDVSCLHDYTLQVSQMRMIESAQVVVMSGAGLEDFLEFSSSLHMIDASKDIPLLEGACHHHAEHTGHDEDHDAHHHEHDAHIWLSPANAKKMAENICAGLSAHFPENANTFQKNLQDLSDRLEALETYGSSALTQLSTRELITFHDGFQYLAYTFHLPLLASIEEEAGSEAGAKEMDEIIRLVKENNIPVIFTESNGSDATANAIARETGCAVAQLSMIMDGREPTEEDSSPIVPYAELMLNNLHTLINSFAGREVFDLS